MNWPAALYTATLWMLLASFWQLYRPLAAGSSQTTAALHVVRDIVPALLLGVLVGMIR